ncbi:MAG: hypothetical protein IPK22_02680 [Verrucomicrobiaceae bacterium]|nr:hypothetical protein [Verrucomicrobiaceae bacterium]
MSVNDIFDQTEDAYLSLIHPVVSDDAYRQQIAPIITLAPCVSEYLVAEMITGESWRERLVGIFMAMARPPASLIEPLMQSLRDPRGISIVPACAALAVLARRGLFTMPEAFAEMFDRQAFDGEVGWALDKAMHFAGLREGEVAGNGPNYGQVFDDHVWVYSWGHAA